MPFQAPGDTLVMAHEPIARSPREPTQGHDHDVDEAPDELHDDGHGHDGHGHDHDEPESLWRRLTHAVKPHSHDTAASVDSALEASSRGIRALLISLAVLGATAAIQGV